MSAELTFDGESAYYVAGCVKWYPQADGGPMCTWPPPLDAVGEQEQAEK